MEIRLGENIRAFRKQRGLTQEQLAEVMGVTVGAVHKWEAKLSLPDMTVIMELADFFDTSVDTLIGYAMKDNRLGAAEKRLWKCHREKDPEGLMEAEKALKKYPNAFKIAYAAATLYHGSGMEMQDAAKLRRALELYERTRQLLPQNQDASISEQTLCGAIAQVYAALGEQEEAIRLLKEQNAGNLYSAMIGVALAAELNRTEEALPYLVRGMNLSFENIIYEVMGFAHVYRARDDHQSGMAVLRCGIQFLKSLKGSQKPDYVDKVCAVMHVMLAAFQINTNDGDAARDSLERGVALAHAFDGDPDYSLSNLRFIGGCEQVRAAYDILGNTAVDAVENALADAGSKVLWDMYRALQAERAKGMRE